MNLASGRKADSFLANDVTVPAIVEQVALVVVVLCLCGGGGGLLLLARPLNGLFMDSNPEKALRQAGCFSLAY